MKKSEIGKRFACEVCYASATTFILNTGDEFINFESDEVEYELDSGVTIPVCHKCLKLVPGADFRELSYAEYHEVWLRSNVEDGMEWVKCNLEDLDAIRIYFNELMDKYVAEAVMDS